MGKISHFPSKIWNTKQLYKKTVRSGWLKELGLIYIDVFRIIPGNFYIEKIVILGHSGGIRK